LRVAIAALSAVSAVSLRSTHEMNEEDVGRYVAAFNQHRRSRIKPLTQEEERAKAEAAMREHPEWTDRRIAEACGISHPFVAKVRTEMSRRTEMQPLVQSSEKTRSYTGLV
jgi:hypothetical protein